MKLLVAFLFFALVAVTASAQTHPPKPEGTNVGTLAVQTDVYTESTGTTLYTTTAPPKKRNTIIFEVVVLLTSSGTNEYQIEPTTIRLSGDDIDNLTTAQIYEAMYIATVNAGINAGYTGCSKVFTSTPQTTVWTESCVSRVGSGTDTRFYPLSSTFEWRDYSVVCGTTDPVITVINSYDPGCTSTSAVW